MITAKQKIIKKLTKAVSQAGKKSIHSRKILLEIGFTLYKTYKCNVKKTFT